MSTSKNVTPRDQTSDLRVSCSIPRARSGDRYSGVPYPRSLTKALAEFGSCFSAKPKSTRTGVRVLVIRMLAGLRGSQRMLLRR